MSSVPRIRHFVNFHNPDVVGSGFRESKTFSVATNKRVRDLAGDWVWMVGREANGTDVFLYGRFRIDADGLNEHPEFKFTISGSNGVWFKPPVKINDLDWFPLLQQKTSNFNTAFQAITDDEILNGMRAIANPPALAKS